MESAVRDNDYVLIVCTPYYVERSNQRRGGVGYEGDIMTAEVLTSRSKRKFIPLFRAGDYWEMASPTWLREAYSIDFRGDPYSDEQYSGLLITLHGIRPLAPPLGSQPMFVQDGGAPDCVAANRTHQDYGSRSPLGWEHINLTGDYLWRMRTIRSRKFRPLRPLPSA